MSVTSFDVISYQWRIQRPSSHFVQQVAFSHLA